MPFLVDRALRPASLKRTCRALPTISLWVATALVVGPAALAVDATAITAQDLADMDGEALYDQGCASCHSFDGTGLEPGTVELEVPVPDFTDCSFASREPDADWIAVAHAGGLIRGFDETMPAFGEAFSVEHLQLIMDHTRTFCSDDTWPRGEFNLPRALVTEKAYPEDEAVTTVNFAAEGSGVVMNELVFERRFGSRSQYEVVLPFGVREGTDDAGWQVGLGDIELGLKRALWHSLESGSIVSVGTDVKIPTGDEDKGFGSGAVLIEPYVAFGQILPGDGFIHAQGIVEFPTDSEKASTEAVWRFVLGKTFAQGPLGFGRAWSPMVEVLGDRELGDVGCPTETSDSDCGHSASWDLLPQVQVTLNTRQHVIANVGVRIPVTESEHRDTQILVYLLWDWFDGGFFDGW